MAMASSLRGAPAACTSRRIAPRSNTSLSRPDRRSRMRNVRMVVSKAS
eukprot:CAMPEP_0115871300 /NCGR_PEP_ID=MMETSP0287-20121206/22792_1 /TAXON_ID=412157 /ORGANISM="Chrysochromulina rotalis, Strain UIO044" /LENGTH=47 /DNA_ID= /DNA_START= /DNA_END= /DNA_ORIENTATION=